jgi:hypothetical protein
MERTRLRHAPRDRQRPLWPAAILLALALAGQSRGALARETGASIPWRTYEAEDMKTDGVVLGPSREPYRVETESSGLRCVRLQAAGQYLQFVAAAPANTMVVRYCLPDAARGGGVASSLGLYVNGRRQRTLLLSSRYSWLYGKYPFSNDPAQGKPRDFYDEVNVPDVTVARGDLVRLQWERRDAAYCIVDLVDLEEAPPPRERPAGSLSVRDFGAQGDGTADDTVALRRCVAAAAVRGGVVWIPPGRYRITGDIVLASPVTLQGAGMWRTWFTGDARLYADPARRVRFKLTARGIVLSDFSIQGRLDYRNDQEPNDGIIGIGCSDCVIRRIGVEHTKVGVWIYNGAHLRIEGCRFRNLLADGVNLCLGTCDSVVENCTARGTGDDCFAIWPTASDQGLVEAHPKPGGNLIRDCTGQLPFLANGAALYGGRGNRIERCAFTDITAGCGLLISTTFPTADSARGIDNNFSGVTVIRDCALRRCGGYDHDWGWRGALQICLDGRDISGLRISGVKIVDSLSDGLTIVAADTPAGQQRRTDLQLDSSAVAWSSAADAARHHGLLVGPAVAGELRGIDNHLGEWENHSPDFRIVGADGLRRPAR